MFLNRSKCDVFIPTDIEMPLTVKKAFCVLEYTPNTVEQDAIAFVRVLKTAANSNANFDMVQKIQRGRLLVPEKRIRTELMCAVSQAERILNMFKIGHEIHISLNFSSKFGGIILILLNIKPV